MPTTTGKATDFITFSRASLATVTDSDGRIKWAPHNLLLASEQFDASQWTKTSATVAANSVAAPNSTTTADTVTASGANGTALQTWTAEAVAYTFGVWLKRKTGTGNIQIAADSGTYTTVAITSDWALYTVSQTPAAGSKSAGIRVVTSGDEVYAWGAHLYRSDLGGMVANTSAYPMYNPTTPKNLLGYTEAFDNAYWQKNRVSVTANAVISPNGLQTADFIVPTAVSGTHTINILSTPPAITAGTNFTMSVYVKAGGYSKVALREDASTGAYAAFSLSGSGSVIASGAGGTGAITALSDGWYRISMLSAANAGPNFSVYVLDNGYTSGSLTAYSYTGDGTSGIYLWGAQLSDSASLDTYVANNFAAPSAAAFNGPRLDYDPSTLAARGLLVEEQRSNVVLLNGMTSVTGSAGSQYPNATGWADEFNTGGTRTYVASNAVPGFNAIDISNVSNARNLISFSFSAASSTTYSVSFYIESFNGVTGAISYAVGALGTGGTSNIISSPTSTGRVSYTFTTGTGAGTVTIRLGIGVAQNQNGSIRISGLQVEAGSFSTSLIPTTSASVTRSADVAQVGTSAFPYSASEGTLVANVVASAGSYGSYMSDGTANNYILTRSAGSGVAASVVTGGVLQANIGTSALSGKIGVAYKLDDFAVSVNGGAAATDTSGSVPTGVTQLRLGAAHDGGANINGWVRQITYIPRRLSNAELQSRTA